MTTYFNDTFDGSGTLVGHTPNTGYSGLLWVADSDYPAASTPNLSGGYIVCSTDANPASKSCAAYDNNYTGNGIVAPMQVSFTFKTGPAVGVNGTFSYVGMEIGVSANGVNSGARVVGNYRAGPVDIQWLLELPTYSRFVDITSAITANTEYVGTMLIRNGSLSITLAGATLTEPAAFPNTDATGLNKIGLVVGGGAYKIGALLIESVPSTALLTAPSATLSASGGPSAGSGNVTAVAPSATATSFGGASAALNSPSPALYANAHDSAGEQAANLTAPSPTLSITTGANSKLAAPRQTLSTTGTVTGWGVADLSSPSPALSATGKVSGMADAALSITTTYSLVGYSGAVCSIALSNGATLQATGTTGGTGGAQLACPLFELTAGATAQNYGGANLLAPSPRLGTTAQAWLVAPGAQLTAIGSAVVTATYEAYAINLQHTPKRGVEPVDEATRYTNFPFTHVIRHKGSYYGANSTGLYLLEGTTDDTAPITWAVKTAITDFGNSQLKTVASAYFGGRLGPADTVTLHAGEGAQVQAYSYTTPRGALAQNYRQAFGKGIKKHRYYALAASGSGEMALDNVDLDVHNLTRRI